VNYPFLYNLVFAVLKTKINYQNALNNNERIEHFYFVKSILGHFNFNKGKSQWAFISMTAINKNTYMRSTCM
jgi:hypothetical protein